MTSPIHPFVAAALLVAASACSTYDFAAAQRPDGSYDTQRLIADLEASGEESLSDGTWIPLLYLDLRRFEKNDVLLPAGYTLSHLRSYGPLFCTGSREFASSDAKGAEIETGDREWAGWGLLYHDRDDYVATTHGRRLDYSQRFLLLFGSDGRIYAGDRK